MSAQRNREEARRLRDRVRGKPSTFIPYSDKQTRWKGAKGFHADRFAAASDGGKQLNAPARQSAHSASHEDRQRQHSSGRGADDFRIKNIRRLRGEPEGVDV